MKPVVIFDTSLFAIPNAAQSTPDIQHIIETINGWAERLENQNCVDFSVISDAIDVLTDSNCFPATHNIQSLLDLYDLSHVFTAQEINSRIFSILSRSSYVFEAAGLEVVEFDRFESQDVDVSQSPSEALTNAFCRVLGSSARSTKRDILRVVHGFPRSEDPVKFSMAVTSVLSATNELTPIDNPEHVASSASCVLGPTDFLRSLDPTRLWELSETEIEFSLAINLEISVALGTQSGKIPLENPYSSLVGTEFIASLRRNQAFGTQPNASTVLKKCAEAVAGAKGEFVRDFRINRDGDDARAYRMHITKSHEALRLLFWIKTTNQVEFANIGPKNELHIVPGDHRRGLSAIF